MEIFEKKERLGEYNPDPAYTHSSSRCNKTELEKKKKKKVREEEEEEEIYKPKRKREMGENKKEAT